jgi:CheY-like chemotaxis protein
MSSVLIVDDEPAVRDLMSRWVSALGLQPHTAANAEEALASLRRQHCDLAVIDVMMPGRDGLWLAAEMQREHPHTAVIVATAYTELLGGEAPYPPIADFLVKPFQRDRFALAVDRGRQWRKLALEAVHGHAMLAIELRDRAEQVLRAMALRVDRGVSEADALAGLLVERMPAVAAHSERVARYARSVACALDTDRMLGPPRYGGALSRRRQDGDARSARLQAVAVDGGGNGHHAAARRRRRGNARLDPVTCIRRVRGPRHA